MSKIVAAVTVLLAMATVCLAEHPRLMFGADDVAGLREKIQREPFKSMFTRLKADARMNNWGTAPIDMSSDYDRIIAGQREAFLYVLTGNDAHAKFAREMVERAINDNRWANRRTKGLSLYVNGMYVALIYDWCYGAPSWDEAFRKTVSQKLLQQADTVFDHGGAEQNRNSASNWQGLRFSTAGLMYLATDEEFDRAKLERAYANTQRYMRDNMGPDAKSAGWNIEGLGYTYYPIGNGVAPFAVAMHRADPSKDLRTTSAGTRMTLWTCFAALIKNANGGMFRPDFGDDNPGVNFEGTLGFAFWFCPPELHPGLAWWYDRTVGMGGNKSFDNSRFGIISSILFHPGDTVKPADPMTIPAWRDAFLDTGGNGFFTFRNQYLDENDVVVQLYAKLRGNRGHSGPDALSFRIAGLNTIWATGGGRYGPKTGGVDVYQRSMNTLYLADPDGPLRSSGSSGKVVGEPRLFDTGGGTVTLSINPNNLGVANHTRRMLTEFGQSRTDPHAAVVIVDTSDNGKVWQMVTLEPNKITTSGNTFTITGVDGSTLRGTVLYPDARNVSFKTGTRIRGSKAFDIERNNFVHFSSDDGCHVVVLTLAKKGQSHPKVSLDGTFGKAPNGTITVGDWQFKADGNSLSRVK